MSTNHTLPKPPPLPIYAWRPASIDDAPAIFQMMLDIDAHDNRHWAGTLAETENEFKDPDLDAATDTLLALAPSGDAAALAMTYVPREVETEHRGMSGRRFIPGIVRLSSKISSCAGARPACAQILAQRQDDLPRPLRGGAMSHDQARIDLFTRHGYTPIRHFFEMRRDLAHPIASPTLPPHLQIQPWRDELDRPVFDAFNESFRDHWGFEPVSEEVWRLFFTGRESFRPKLSFVVMAGEEVAGFSVNYYSPEENERKGIDEAWIGDLGTRRPWRKQGIATALLNHSMLAFQAAGIPHASLGVDSENPTGALGVYERVGFKVVERSVSLGKYISDQRKPVLLTVTAIVNRPCDSSHT